MATGHVEPLKRGFRAVVYAGKDPITGRKTYLTQRLSGALRGRLDMCGRRLRSHSTGPARFRFGPISCSIGPEQPVFVADIKYKLAENARARREDCYQLLAYATALALREGLLVYCRARNEKPASIVEVVRGGPTLHIVAIDVSGPPDAVETEIRALAKWVAARFAGEHGTRGPAVQPPGGHP